MNTLKIDDEVVRWAVAGRAATSDDALTALAGGAPLLMLLHGYGSFEGDLIELAPALPHEFVCASPRAPLTAPPPVVGGYAWFPIAFAADGTVAAQPDPTQFEGSAPHAGAISLLDWLDALDARVARARTETKAADESDRGTRAIRTAVPMGFSQGAAMAMSLLRLRPGAFPAAVNCSGFVTPGASAHDLALAGIQPPVFWGRDPLDPVIDDARIAYTADWLPRHTALEAHTYDGILHGIGADEVADISAFLNQHVLVSLGQADHTPRAEQVHR